LQFVHSLLNVYRIELFKRNMADQWRKRLDCPTINYVRIRLDLSFGGLQTPVQVQPDRHLLGVYVTGLACLDKHFGEPGFRVLPGPVDGLGPLLPLAGVRVARLFDPDQSRALAVLCYMSPHDFPVLLSRPDGDGVFNSPSLPWIPCLASISTVL